MSTVTEQIASIYKRIPLQKRIIIGLFLLLVIGGFLTLFMIGNKMEYQPLFGKLSAEDAAIIIDKLKEQRIPYKLDGGGNLILVPADSIYDIRLSLAGLGLPKSGTVGFELFDKTDFGTTEFVQKLNYQRALQGELARTIKAFNEVADARVMIVMPKDSVFIAEAKKPSASVMLTLRSDLPKSKVAAVVNLVASAVEGLTPDSVTVVDASGKVLSKRTLPEEKAGELADTQMEYKNAFEGNLAQRIQSMLEKIAGSGNAIVRVSADLDFSQVDTNEERFDPEAQVLRSRQISTETSDSTKAGSAGVSSVSPPANAPGGNQSAEKSQRQNETVNYEINRTVKRTTKPMAEVKRLSVAAVLDGNYAMETGKDGAQVRKYVARTQAELDQVKKIVQQAMGFSEDRGDQVTVESLPFTDMSEMAMASSPGIDWLALLRRYGHLAGYAFLIVIAFLFIVRPLVRAMTDMSVGKEQRAIPAGKSEETELSLPAPDSMYALPEPSEISAREKAVSFTKQDPDKAVEYLRGWLSEAS